jgi:hypothetical protein
MRNSCSSYACYMPYQFYPSVLITLTILNEEHKIIKPPLCIIFYSPFSNSFLVFPPLQIVLKDPKSSTFSDTETKIKPCTKQVNVLYYIILYYIHHHLHGLGFLKACFNFKISYLYYIIILIYICFVNFVLISLNINPFSKSDNESMAVILFPNTKKPLNIVMFMSVILLQILLKVSK